MKILLLGATGFLGRRLATKLRSEGLDVVPVAKSLGTDLRDHRQFKAVTSMSPLQYQKALRLQEARRLMLTAALDPGAAGRRVGYSSASQFTREYGRFFGNAPTRDLQRLREHGIAETEISS